MLRHRWDFTDEFVVVPWTDEVESDLMWWFDTNHLLQGVCLEVQHSDLLFWSDTSDHGWGDNLHNQFVSGRWSVEEHSLSINLRELRTICLGLHHFRHSLKGMTVGVFTNSTTALSYVKKQGGMYSVALYPEVQHLRWAESLELTLVPKFIVGSQNVVTDSLSHSQ